MIGRAGALLIGLTAACLPPNPSALPPAVLPSQAESNLRALMPKAPRRGDLVVTAQTLQLRLRRGEQQMTLLNVPRGTYEHGCHVPRAPELPEGVVRSSQASWWLFTHEDHAVALELTTREIAAWFWDAARECPVRVRVLDLAALDDHPPQRYYKAEDAQIAYRHERSGSADLADAPEVTGDEEIDILPARPGPERLIADPDIIAIRGGDGRVLLQEEFRVDPGWPCYNTQLDVFRGPAGEVYAIAAFDTWGDRYDCEQGGGDVRFSNAVFDYEPRADAFVPRYRFLEQRRPLSPEGEDSLFAEEHWLPVAGGWLHTTRREVKRFDQGTHTRCTELDRATGTCLRSQACWVWSSDDDRAVSFVLEASDGLTVPLGEAAVTMRERGEDCEANVP